MIFAASAVFVFLILASLYESWSLPVAVFMTAPIAILGGIPGPVDVRAEPEHLFGNRPHRADCAGGQECHPHRGIRRAGTEAGTDLLTATLDAARIRCAPS